jgi:hypothetical protein
LARRIGGKTARGGLDARCEAALRTAQPEQAKVFFERSLWVTVWR